MKKVIINADDCGASTQINHAIEEIIRQGMLSSATVMANGDDLNGAIKLYEKYGREISFGAHLNITTRHPLSDPSILLKKGFCIEDENGIHFEGKKFRNKKLDCDLSKAILKELMAQIDYLRKVGIKLSHIDSHQHIHTGPFMIPIFCEAAKESGLMKMRRPRNVLKCNLHNVIGGGKFV